MGNWPLSTKPHFQTWVPVRFLNLLYLSIGKSDRTLKFFRQNIIVIELYIALVQKKSTPLKRPGQHLYTHCIISTRVQGYLIKLSGKLNEMILKENWMSTLGSCHYGGWRQTARGASSSHHCGRCDVIGSNNVLFYYNMSCNLNHD